MTSLSPATFPSPLSSASANHHHHNFSLPNPNFTKNSARFSQSPTLCRSQKDNNIIPSADNSPDHGWNSGFKELVRNVLKSFVIGGRHSESEEADGEVEDEDWDWDRWNKHFTEIDQQERIVSVLKSQLTCAINREDYGDAARLKVAIAATTTNDTVGRVMSHLNKAIEEERYEDAAFVRDYAGAGLVGWWAGVSEDGNDPYGRIIHISAEHGRYVARSYSPWQLATHADGARLFEIYVTRSKKGEYKEQAVYLEQRAVPQDFSIASFESLGPTISLDDPLDPTADKVELFKEGIEDADDDSDISQASGIENILQDMITSVEFKVSKVTVPGKVDRDIISKMVEQIIEEEDKKKDTELESVDADNDNNSESDEEQSNIAMDSTSGFFYGKKQSHTEIKIVIGGLVKIPGSSHKDLLRVPARLEKKGRLSFCFTVEEGNNQQVSDCNVQSLLNEKTKLQGHSSINHIIHDLAKSIGRGKIPMKVLKNAGQLLKFALSQAQNRLPLSGSTTFSHIDVSATPDPLNGLYIGVQGVNTSEVIEIRRKFGQWQEDGSTKEPQNLELYEYIEAVKLTGDPYVPAGQVAFRAKVGKRYQLPHKGIIPQEFRVIARYKGQGRLAEPGFQNPRWVDGEVVVLDGKYLKGGPIIGFVYWAPEYHFLAFFHQLRLQK